MCALANLRADVACTPLPPQWESQLEDAAEFGRIGRYYAIEDMLTTDPAERYGRTTLREHYERIAKEGQDYDPYTTLFGSQKGKEAFAAEKAGSGQ